MAGVVGREVEAAEDVREETTEDSGDVDAEDEAEKDAGEADIDDSDPSVVEEELERFE